MAGVGGWRRKHGLRCVSRHSHASVTLLCAVPSLIDAHRLHLLLPLLHLELSLLHLIVRPLRQ